MSAPPAHASSTMGSPGASRSSRRARSEGEELDAAADVQPDAGYVARQVRTEEGDRVRDVLWLACAPHGRPPHHALVHLRVAESKRLGADDPRDDGVAGDPVARAFEGERARQPEEARLRRGIARLTEAAEGAGDREIG